MRKITLFLALMVTMMTTAFAQNVKVDVSKQYYLKATSGTTTGYFNLGEHGANTKVLLLADKQALTFEKVYEDPNSTDPYYIISAMVTSGTSTELTKTYLSSGGWDAQMTTDAAKAERVVFEKAGTDNTTVYIKRVKGDKAGRYFEIATVGGTDTRKGIYTDKEKEATTTAIWTLEEVVAEPAGLTVVSQSPAADEQVESLSSITIEFNKAVKLDWAPSEGTGTGTDATGTGTDATGTGTDATGTGTGTSTGTGSVDHIKLKTRDDRIATTAWFKNVVIDGNKVTFKFDATVKTTDTYKFTIPADLIIAAEGDEKYAGGTFTFKVYAPAAPTYTKCSFEPQPDWINCYTLEQIKVIFSEKIEIVGTDALELKNGEEVVATITDTEVGTDGKSLYLYLEEDEFVTPEVTTEYSLVIPEGYVKTAGTNLGLANDVTVTGTVKARFMVKDIKPAIDQTVETIEKIVVEFNMAVNANTANKLVLRNNENGDEVALTASLNEEGKELTLTPTRPVVNGAYTLRQEKLNTSNGLQAIAAAGGDAIYQAPLYTITVDGPELDELELKSSDRNPLLTAWEGEYKLAGVKLNFFEIVEGTTVEDKVKLRDGVTEYGKIVDAEGNTVAVLDKKMGANDHNYATLYTSTPVTTAGTYKVIVYSGVIVTMDGEAEYKGGEFEFTVAERGVEIEGIEAPAAEVTSMRNCLDYEITINYYNTVEVDDEKSVTMTVGEKTYTAEVTPVEESWGYVIYIAFDAEAEYDFGDYTLTIPEGLYTVNDVANAEDVYTFTYADVQPIAVVGVEVEKDENGAIVSISFEFNQAVSANEEFYLGDCKFMKPGAFPSQWATYWAVTEDGEYSALTTPGEYSLYIQQVVGWNAILADDQQAIYTFNVAGEVKDVTATVTYPSTEQIDAIKVEFSDDSMYDCIFGYLFLRKGNDTYYLLAAPDYGKGVFVVVDPTKNDEPIVITEPGIYTLDLNNLADYGLTGELEFSWTIGETTAIDAVDAEAENAVIYDLTGRRVEKITKAGIYVINGVKKVVK